MHVVQHICELWYCHKVLSWELLPMCLIGSAEPVSGGKLFLGIDFNTRSRWLHKRALVQVSILPKTCCGKAQAQAV